MRTFILLSAVCMALAACGNRTPLTLPKPDSKPPASAPAQQGEAR